MVNYSSRLKAAMDLRLISITMLARGIGLSYQAIKKVLDGKTRELGTLNTSNAAKYLSVDAQWLAVGESDDVIPISRGQATTGDLFAPSVSNTHSYPELSPLAMELAYTFDELTDRTLRNRAYSAATNEIFKQAQQENSGGTSAAPTQADTKEAQHA